ncbi:MAG: DUF421 domain-containing protein [Clostridia bacterium]|nr:DUF421 domain-containing protein [Clostridia bacterium]
MAGMMTRLVFIYFFTLISARLMGKRQIGELQLSELVSAFFLSEIATVCVTDADMPVLGAAFSVLTVVTLEIIISFLSAKSVIFKRLFDEKPSFLIRRGKPVQKELERNRVTLGELMAVIRQNGIGDVTQVESAVLESNGKISVLLKDEFCAATSNDLNLKPDRRGMSHALISDGNVDAETLKLLGKSRKWLEKELKSRGFGKPEEMFLVTLDDGGKLFAVKKEKK